MDERTLNSELEAGNFKLPLKPLHRKAMLDLVLAWGTLDGALAMPLAHVMGLPCYEAADTIGKQNGSGKLAEMIRLIKQRNSAEDAGKFLKKHKNFMNGIRSQGTRWPTGIVQGISWLTKTTSCSQYSNGLVTKT